MDNQEKAKVYVGELLERILRFELHLTSVEESEIYRRIAGRSDSGGSLKRPLFLDSFRDCLDQLLAILFHLARRTSAPLRNDDLDQLMLILRQGFVTVNELHHDGLAHLPRPSEPIELRRFLRMIARHVLARTKPDLAVYITEETTETAFANDPLAELKNSNVSQLADLASTFLDEERVKVSIAPKEFGIHVTIARIDARNPLRWPTLLHETAHRLISGYTTKDQSLVKQFSRWLPNPVRKKIDELEVDQESWLVEVWCDLFAALVLGPAFFFGQYAAFVTSPPSDSALDKKYPPHGCRLRLISDFLRHRCRKLTQDYAVRNHMAECLTIIEYWDQYHRIDIAHKYALKVFYDSMRCFFQEHFFTGPGTGEESLHSRFSKMVRYVEELNPVRLKAMQRAISEGLPAPSKPRQSDVWFAEEPTSIQEVLLAAWLDRLDRLRQKSVDALIAQCAPPSVPKEKDKVLAPIKRFDDAVLRSLQLAEWLHVLAPKEPAKLSSALLSSDVSLPTQARLLNDREIAELLKSGDLRLVPLVELDQQLGSTSLDVRLGTSFEVYLPAYRRSPAIEDSDVPAYDSVPIDLDFLERVVLLPGQIILAHTFEYVRLPSTVAAELEGRSSYARLGLEVHLSAGMIDPGFEGVITLELVNNGPNPIFLFPGVRIGQLRFSRVNPPARPYSQRHVAKYSRLLHHHKSLYETDRDYLRIIQEVNKQKN